MSEEETSKRSPESNGDDYELTSMQKCCYAVGCDCCHGGDSIVGVRDGIIDDEDRASTDVAFCVLMILVFIIQAIILGICRGEKDADPSWLTQGRDYLGNTCDDYTMWPDPYEYKVRVCVDSCGATLTSDYMVVDSTGLKTFSGNDCGYESEAYMDHWCIPTGDDISIGGLGGAQQSVNNAFGDMITAQNFLIFCMLSAAVISFGYSWVLQYCAHVIVWLSIFLASLGGFFIGYILMTKAADVADAGYDNTADGMWGLGACIVIMDFIFLCVIFTLRDKINMAAKVTSLAASAFTQIKSLFIFPLPIFIALLGYFAFWITIALYIASVEVHEMVEMPNDSGCGGRTLRDVLNVEEYIDYDWDGEMQNYFIFHFAAGIWTVQFIIYWSYAVLSGAFAQWYFSPFKDDTSKELDGNVLCKSAWIVTRYHMGTIAFGSLIIACVRMLRAWLLYIEETFMNHENCLSQCLMRCVNCILWCFQNCIDKISKDGFVFMAVYGKPFCSSSICAFNTIWNHLTSVAAISIVSAYVEVIGKVAITLINTGLMLFLLPFVYEEDELSSYTFLGLAFLCISYLVAIVFMHIFDVAIETLFICYVMDLEANKGTPKHASADWNKMIEDTKAENQKQADRMVALKKGDKNAKAGNVEMSGNDDTTGEVL